MTEQAGKFAVVLYELAVPAEMIGKAGEVFRGTPELAKTLASPVIPEQKKHRVLELVFTEPEYSRVFLHFLDKVCDDGCITEMDDIFKAWLSYKRQQEGILEAELFYVTKPDESQISQFKEFLCKKYHKNDVIFCTVNRPELLGGFVLKVGDMEYDDSLAGRMKKLRRAVVKQQAL